MSNKDRFTVKNVMRDHPGQDMKRKAPDAYLRGVILIILSAFFFAGMNAFVRLSGDIPSIQKSFFRNAVAAVFAAGIILRNHVPLHVQKNARFFLLMRCVFGTIGVLCNFYAVDHLLMADASILNKLSPFFAILCSYFVLKEKITPFQAACVLLAFIGCLFVVKPGFQNAALIPALIGVAGGFTAGVAYTMVRKVGMLGTSGPIIVFYFSAFSCLSVLPWIITHFAPMAGWQVGCLLLAGLCAAGGQFSITGAYTYAPARKISIYDYSQILFSTLLGFFLFGEMPDGLSFLGYILIIAASVIMFLYNRRHQD